MYENPELNLPDMNCLIYPVPLKSSYALGIHLTVNPYGNVKIGPTAIPVLWNYQYKYLDNFHLK